MASAENRGKYGAQVMDVAENPGKFAAQVCDWKEAAVLGTVCGMLTEGATNPSTSKVVRALDRGLNLGFGKAAKKSLRNRLLRATCRPINGGVISGTFFATYIGVHNWAAEKRGVLDLYNTFLACSAAGWAFFVTAVRAPPPPRYARMTVPPALFAVIGSTIAGACLTPFGWLHLKMLEKMKEDMCVKAAMKDV